jgi:hypothetical protein
VTIREDGESDQKKRKRRVQDEGGGPDLQQPKKLKGEEVASATTSAEFLKVGERVILSGGGGVLRVKCKPTPPTPFHH